VTTRGLIVRHLVMPGMLKDARQILQWIARELGPQTFVNVMPYYTPYYRADRHPEIARATTPEEWRHAIHVARAAGLVEPPSPGKEGQTPFSRSADAPCS